MHEWNGRMQFIESFISIYRPLSWMPLNWLMNRFLSCFPTADRAQFCSSSSHFEEERRNRWPLITAWWWFTAEWSPCLQLSCFARMPRFSLHGAVCVRDRILYNYYLPVLICSGWVVWVLQYRMPRHSYAMLALGSRSKIHRFLVSACNNLLVCP